MINFSPVHPGAILKEELDVRGITPTHLAATIEIPKELFLDILSERRSISGDTALRLGHYFGTGEKVWMNLQGEYELGRARQKSGSVIAALPKLPPEEGAEIG